LVPHPEGSAGHDGSVTEAMPDPNLDPQARLEPDGVAEPPEPAPAGSGAAPEERAHRRHLASRVLRRMWPRLFEDRILGMAAEAGFWAIVSLPSLALTLLGAIGYLKGVLGPANVRHIHDDILRGARDLLTPGTVNSDVAPLLNQVLDRGHLGVISVGFVISLWSGSTAMSAYVNTITVAYDMRGVRGSVRSRVVATELYLCFVAVGVVLLPALALGPGVIADLTPGQVGDEVSTLVHIVYWPAVALLSVSLIAGLYKAALPVRVRWRRCLPGAFVAMGLWLLGSLAVRAYMQSSFRSKSGYGPLGAPIAALLFFYITALAVLLGAELNSSIDSVSPDRSAIPAGDRLRPEP
jgi:membrane protein